MKKLDGDLLSVNDFKILKNIKNLIQKEFNEDLKFDDENLLNVIRKYSEKEKGTEIYEEMSKLSIVQIPSEKSEINFEKQKENNIVKEESKFSLGSLFSKKSKPKKGDVINGKIVKGTYRGRIIFED